jgi:2,3-dihydroxybiphenyl 1,2-dioxygenase
MAIHPGTDKRLAYVGWELKNRDDSEAALDELDRAGVAYRRGSGDCSERRRVDGLACLSDPAGIELELFYGPHITTELFRPTRDLSRFVALGHVTLGVADPRPVEEFYTRTLGFRVSDYIDFLYGEVKVSAVFLHAADGRHHSLAFADVGRGLHHVMIEVGDIDDVGRTLDSCQTAGVRIAQTLGRHTNDRMISFYMLAPGGFQIEYGCGGLYVDDTSWRVTRMSSASRWGHKVVRSPS